MVDERDGEIPFDASFVGIVNSVNITARNLNLTIDNNRGLVLAYSMNCTVENSLFVNNWWALTSVGSANNIIRNNNLTNNFAAVVSYSSSNLVTSNTIGYNEAGIHSTSSSDVIDNNLIISNGDYHGIFLLSGANNFISNNNVTMNGVNIYLENSSNNTVTSNYISRGDFGIRLESSFQNEISNNRIINNMNGVEIASSCRNYIANNELNNRYDMWIEYSSFNKLRGNNFSAEYYSLSVYGRNLAEYLHDIDVSNTVKDKPIYYLLNQTDVLISPATHPAIGYLALINCFNVTVKDIIQTRNYQGITLAYTNNSRIENVNIEWNYNGVFLFASSNNFITESIITSNEDGVRLQESSNNNTIQNNDIKRHRAGLLLISCDNNVIVGNNLAENEQGIYSYDSGNNLIYHNNFIENSQNVYTHLSNNIWDNGYSCGGNYWDDYTGTDIHSGPYQNETGNDGIGDTPHVIASQNTDHYPLMYPLNVATPAFVNATTFISPQILNLGFKGKWIAAYIELPKTFRVDLINFATVKLNETFLVDFAAPIEIGDYDEDKNSELVLHFNRTAIVDLILSEGVVAGNITLTISGQLFYGTLFNCSQQIQVRMPGDINIDGTVGAKDAVAMGKAFGSHPDELEWNSAADENEDGYINVKDAILLGQNYGKTYT